MREVIEYRAVGVDSDGGGESAWTPDKAKAETWLATFRSYSDDPDIAFDDTFLERRRVVFGEPERVVEENDGN